MAQLYHYSDPHFSHLNIAIKRGFQTVEEHDEYIIQQWNSTVNKNDKIFLHGDITMEKDKYSILKRLKGQIVVIGGNHDKPGHAKEMLKYVSGFAGAIKYKGFILTHIPIHPIELDDKRFIANIHGHFHLKVLDDKRYINVSAENINYKPVLFTEISAQFAI